MFTLSVFFDVVTRTIGAPWLWLQQVTTGFFAWGVFVGMAAATRRNDHFYLAEITKRMTGRQAQRIEIVNRADRAGGRRLHGLVRRAERAARPRQLPHAVADPADRLHGDRAVAGVLIALFTVEQLVNGWQERLRGPRGHRRFAREPVRMSQRRDPRPDGLACSSASATWACRWPSR